MAFSTQQRIDPAPHLERVCERFGISPRRFHGYHLYRATSQTLYLVPADLPMEPPPLFAGFAFIRDHTRYPKLTTAAAIKYTPYATRNVAQLDESAARAFLNRETFAFTPEATCTGTGFMLIRHGDLPLGLGFYSEERETLRSLFPKTWSGVHHHSIVMRPG
ncbi:MAG: hypothetical protein RhofKO_21600 [Rhodothermales bacterium]